MANSHGTIATWSASDGYQGYYRLYLPPSRPKGMLVCLHGIQSHGGWYEHSSKRFAEAGYVVAYLDRRGSGLNFAHRGDTPNFHRLLADVAEFIVFMKKRHGSSLPIQGGEERRSNSPPPTPPSPGEELHGSPPLQGGEGGVALSACSWGGKVAVGLCRQKPNLIQALMLLCPGFFPQVGVPLVTKLKIGRSKLLRPTRPFDIPLNDPALFTASWSGRQFLRHDPLALRQATARFLVESVRLDRYLREAPPAVTMPVLLLLAGRDRIIRNEPTQTWVESFASTATHIITYPEAHHTFEFEPDVEQMVRDQVAWLDEILSRQTVRGP